MLTFGSPPIPALFINASRILLVTLSCSFASVVFAIAWLRTSATSSGRLRTVSVAAAIKYHESLGVVGLSLNSLKNSVSIGHGSFLDGMMGRWCFEFGEEKILILIVNELRQEIKRSSVTHFT